MLFGTAFVFDLEVKADENWEAFEVTLRTTDAMEAGNQVTFQLDVSNTTNKELKLTNFGHFYYQEYNNSDAYPGVDFGELKDSSDNVITEENCTDITFASDETKSYTLSGVLPDTWNEKSQITVVVGSEQGNDTYLGQADYPAIEIEAIPSDITLQVSGVPDSVVDTGDTFTLNVTLTNEGTDALNLEQCYRN